MSSTTNWFDLPLDLKINILSRVDPVTSLEILENTQFVCTDWYKVCKNPSMWKVINLYGMVDSLCDTKKVKLCKHVVDRSQGQSVEIIFPPRLESDEVLLYLGNLL
ncbi:putative F-box/LRR-repeat protein 21 [Rutidosis leptorrhynchoides]|uniref:putative F-box/LRR-repeat protein 21 n=1 Tax=Rutidosis leptorrhynchoides TaxID=125765 RepID=UPI003A99D6AF